MHPIALELKNAAPRGLDTVLHVGAGPEGPEDPAGFDCRQWVLVEGDAESFAEMELVAAHVRSPARLMHAVVLPQAGPATWHRYNVRHLNGPQPADGADSRYPRLRHVASEPCTGVAMHQLISGIDLTRADLPHALVLDVPGQEASLLAAVPASVLQRFSLVAVHFGGKAPRTAVSAMQASHFEPVPAAHLAAAAESHWVLYRFDERGERLHALESETEALRALTDGAEQRRRDAEMRATADRAELTQVRAELDATQRNLQSAMAAEQSMARRVNEEETSHTAALAQQKDELLTQAAAAYRAFESELAAGALALRHAAEERQVLEARAADQDARVGELNRALQESDRRARDLESEVLASGLLLDELRAKIEVHATTAEATAKAVTALEARAAADQGALDSQEALIASLRREHEKSQHMSAQALAQEQAALSGARDAIEKYRTRISAQSAAYESLQAHCSDIEREVTAIRAERDDAASQVQHLMQEVASHQATAEAEAQHASTLRDDVAAARAALQSRDDLAASLRHEHGVRLLEAGEALAAERRALADAREAVERYRERASRQSAGRDELTARCAELVDRLEATRKERDDLAAQQQRLLQETQSGSVAAKAAVQRATALETELEAGRQALRSRDADFASMRDEHAEQQRQSAQTLASERKLHAEDVERHRKEAAEWASTQRLTAQLNLLRENDLHELQERFGALRTQSNSQQDLLRRLAERLSAAHAHYQRFAAQAPLNDQEPAVESPLELRPRSDGDAGRPWPNTAPGGKPSRERAKSGRMKGQRP